jgi:DNA replication and repair protein RecF
MAEQGVAIAAARRLAVARLEAALADQTGPFPRARLALAGSVEGWLAGQAALSVEDRLADSLAHSRGEDRLSGGAAVGPHRSDVVVTERITGMPAADGSTGEQKALLVALILADVQAKAAARRAVPLVLLDEIVAHLDPGRRAALFERLLALGAQAWMTGTEPGLFEALGRRAQVFRVADGAIEPDSVAAVW